ncbi:unnamed protein product [Pleuronectes platessa]|uniref:Uncharacterized protein n=1 Tax=Pleuronectes platessa TaxID=8262 RepID=A0A9N7Y434_PLEPL|nr:unnamed protein product [Pleuronectes platessa]
MGHQPRKKLGSSSNLKVGSSIPTAFVARGWKDAFEGAFFEMEQSSLAGPRVGTQPLTGGVDSAEVETSLAWLGDSAWLLHFSTTGSIIRLFSDDPKTFPIVPLFKGRESAEVERTGVLRRARDIKTQPSNSSKPNSSGTSYLREKTYSSPDPAAMTHPANVVPNNATESQHCSYK